MLGWEVAGAGGSWLSSGRVPVCYGGVCCGSRSDGRQEKLLQCQPAADLARDVVRPVKRLMLLVVTVVRPVCSAECRVSGSAVGEYAVGEQWP